MLTKRILFIVGLPLLFAFVVRFIFGVDTWENLFSVMTLSFLVLLPSGIGALTIYLSEIEKVKSYAYRIMMPWCPIFGFFVLTLIFSVEGWACWLMALPLFMLGASIGGLIAAYFKLKADKSKENLFTSVAVILPILFSPAEQLIATRPETYRAYTYIDITAPKETLWNNVTSVRAINQHQDKGYLTRFLGFPRPIRAELNYQGVGAYRKAIFDKGLVFHEQVLAYSHQQKMQFSIKAYPHEIPSATMDKHVVIGGDYFDVINGTYELEKLSPEKYRLHLYSHFRLTTSFNFYASWWAGWIMKDIQNNILQVIKQRAEDSNS